MCILEWHNHFLLMLHDPTSFSSQNLSHPQSLSGLLQLLPVELQLRLQPFRPFGCAGNQISSSGEPEALRIYMTRLWKMSRTPTCGLSSFIFLTKIARWCSFQRHIDMFWGIFWSGMDWDMPEALVPSLRFDQASLDFRGEPSSPFHNSSSLQFH